jgi:hypothetical protein
MCPVALYAALTQVVGLKRIVQTPPGTAVDATIAVSFEDGLAGALPIVAVEVTVVLPPPFAFFPRHSN